MKRGPAVCALLLLLGSARAFGQSAGGQPAGGDDLDDPKLARRLKTRVAMPIGGAPAATVPGAPPTAASAGDALAVAPSLPPPAPWSPSPARAPSETASRSGATPGSPSGSTADETVIAGDRIAEGPSRAGDERPKTPILQLGYRRFSFVRVGASDGSSTNGKPAGEPFDSLSLDFYPISRLVRFGMSTQYGWQSGTFNSGSGDYFVAQSFSLGVQHAGPTLTPFAEALAGAGYMRRFQFDRTVPTAYWQLGIDAGLEVFLARHAFVSAAIGYLHPVNGFAKEQSFATIYVDTWSLKLGFGI